MSARLGSWTGFGTVDTSMTELTFVPVPGAGAFLLGGVGLAFASWKLRRRKELQECRQNLTE